MFEKMIEDLKSNILESVERYLKNHEKIPPKKLNLISKTELKEELNIGDKTLSSWEHAGLRQYIPPIEDTRKAYYKISEVLKFLGGGRMRVIELILSADKLALFAFLKSTPTQVWKNGNYYKFVYYEPIGEGLTDFRYKGLYVAIRDEKSDREGWELARPLEITLASLELLMILKDLEVNKLTEQRQGLGVELKGWIFDLICNGIHTRYETATLVRLLFVNGYSFSQLVDLFSTIVKRKELASYFLEVATKFYKEVAFE